MANRDKRRLCQRAGGLKAKELRCGTVLLTPFFRLNYYQLLVSCQPANQLVKVGMWVLERSVTGPCAGRRSWPRKGTVFACNADGGRVSPS